MKKSLIALAVMISSGAAHAVEIYSDPTTTLNFSGEAEVQYYKSQTKNVDPAINIATATLNFAVSYEVNGDLTLGTALDAANIDGNDVYISANFFQAHTLSVGHQSTIFDDAGIGSDYSFGFTSYVDNLNTSGDQVIKYKYDGGEVFYTGFAYLMHSNENETDDGYDSSDYAADGNIGARLGDFEYTLFVAQSEQLDLQENNYSLEARYVYGNMVFAGTYGYTDSEQDTGPNTEIDMFGLAATWDDGGRWSYAGGWANIDNSSNTDKINDVYINASYWMTDNVNAYAEIGFTDDDTQETGYVVGMDVSW